MASQLKTGHGCPFEKTSSQLRVGATGKGWWLNQPFVHTNDKGLLISLSKC